MIDILIKLTNTRANVCKLDDHNYLLITDDKTNLKELIGRLRLPHHAGRLIVSTNPNAELMQVHFQATKANWNSYQAAQIDSAMYREIVSLLHEMEKQ